MAFCQSLIHDKRLQVDGDDKSISCNQVKTWCKTCDETGSQIALKDLKYYPSEDVDEIMKLNSHKLKYKVYFTDYIEIIPLFIPVMFILSLWILIFGFKLVLMALLPVVFSILFMCFMLILLRQF